MEIKQKHRKHALRKAVTAAVLAGTAFSSLGGFAGAVTTVKADDYYPKMDTVDEETLVRLGVEFASNRDGKNAQEVRNEIKNLSTESIHALLIGLDPSHDFYNSGWYSILREKFSLMDNDNKNDWWHSRGVELASLLIQEVRTRLNAKDKLDDEILNKDEKLKELTEKIDRFIKEKKGLESELKEKNLKFLRKKMS